MATPQMVRRPRRLASPMSLGGRPLLEQQHQPLYSAAALDNAALPNELNFFGYAKGQAVPGAGNASGGVSTLFHTNLESPNSLASPKVFTVTGLRVILPNIAFTTTAQTPELSDPSFGAAAVDSDIFEDLLSIMNSGSMRFRVGPKDYVHHPLFFFPGNTGIGGLASLGQDNATAATIGELDAQSPHFAGPYYALRTYPIVIATQQSFSASMSWIWATNPSLNDDRLLFVFADGVMSREVS